MESFKFKKAVHFYEWSGAEPEIGYSPYINGALMPYIITKCDTLGDWGVWSTIGEGDLICGGCTYAEAKQTFTRYANKSILNK